ncbi:hypothetical protein [Streptomyces sp. NPDC006527]|uniref:hypothetical protein n=1 Tax=Streptomyces sp. NPDC006527 TaxID=3364749 RepID=UPI0036999671
MLALRLTRSAHPAVQLRRLLVATASAGTGFLLLSTLGHALTHPDAPPGSALRLAWCAVPLAATVHLALAVARTDPGTRPRPGLAAIGLGPARLMAISATTTALSTTLGSLLALLVFLHLRGDLTGMPFDGAAADFLAADVSLPVPAALTLLSLVPATASVSVALALRPRDARPARSRGTGRSLRRFTTREQSGRRETFGAYGRFGSRSTNRPATGRPPSRPTDDAQPLRQTGGRRPVSARVTDSDNEDTRPPGPAQLPRWVPGSPSAPARATDAGEDEAARPPRRPAGSRAAGAARVGAGGTPHAPGSAIHPPATTDDTPETPDLQPDPAPPNPTLLPWGAALLAAGLAVEAYATHTTSTTDVSLPGGPTGPAAVLVGWALTALGLALAGPGLTHLCGRLLQAVRPGALRLLAGRGLMQEASRIGRPLGVVCAVASGAYSMAALYDPADPSVGPLTALGALLVAGCTCATLLTAAVEARQARADTTAALLRLGAPATMLRSAAALRAGALLALFLPLTVLVAELASLPLHG